MKKHCSKCGKLEYMAEFPGQPPLCMDCFFGDETTIAAPWGGEAEATPRKPKAPTKGTAQPASPGALDINPFKLF
jgi:hypothetical protein